MAALQDRFSDQLGSKLQLVSITVDPATDTPQKLKSYAQQFGARPGWHFVTGDRENVEFALRKIGQYTSDRESHSNVFVVGNDRTGLWKKARGTAPIEELAQIVESVLGDLGDYGDELATPVVGE